MSAFENRSAIVTGGASGIGLALCKALVTRGARVWLTDIDAERAAQAAAALGEKASAVTLDVRDAAAVSALIHQVAAECSGLDYLFNNAGIIISGDSQDLTVAHYDRIIDINIRGVTNGVAAAYPLMVQRGRGHIINTASVAGLLPSPLLSPYSMSKHAVLGLTQSLRLEAEVYGVRLSALCPSAIETPLLDAGNPADLPEAWRPDIRRYLTRLTGKPYSAERFAQVALDGVARNKALVIAPASARSGAALYRHSPWLVLSLGRKLLKQEISKRA